jgi:hypothetical protein
MPRSKQMTPDGQSSHGSVFTLPFTLTVVVLWTAGLLRLFYATGSGEHDAFMMATGVVQGARTGEVLNPSCYNPGLQFLFYYIFRVATVFWVPSTAGVLRIMNVIGALSSLATPFLLASVLSSLMHDRPRARLAVLLFAVSPLYFFTLSYGHPFYMALPVFLLSWVILRPLTRPDPDRLAWTRIGVAALLQSTALMIRFEQVALFAGLMIGMLALEGHRQWRRWAVAGGVFIGALLVFSGLRALLVSESGPTMSYAALLSHSVDRAFVLWGSVQLVSEVGLPLLLGVAWIAFLSVRNRAWGVLFLALTGVIPTLGNYIGYPSPPRHFYVAAVGIASVIAAGIPTRWVSRLTLALPLILVLNLITPWGLMLADPRAHRGRAVVSYNVLERTDRNKAEIRAIFPFYEQVLEKARGRRVVLLGNWVHVAQLTAFMIDQPDTRIDRVSIGNVPSALAIRGGGVEVYVVEAYAPGVAAAVEDLRRTHPDVLIVSLVQGGPPVNDLGVNIPAAIYLWDT